MSVKDEKVCPDFLLVLGTSLKVDGPKELVRRFAKVVRADGGVTAYIGLTRPRSEFRQIFDYSVEWDCDNSFRHLKEHAAGAFMSHSPTQAGKCPASGQGLGIQPAETAGRTCQLGSSFQNPIVLD